MNFQRVNPDHSAARAKRDGSDGEKIFEKTAKVGNGDAFAQGGIGDEEGDAAGAVMGDFGKVTKIAGDKISGNAGELGGLPVGAGGLNGVGGEVGAENLADTGQADAFDKFKGRAAEGVPSDFLRKGAGEASHGGGKGRMGGGGDILLAVGKAGIGGEAGTEFDKIADGGGVNFDGPWSFARVVEEIGAESVDTLGDLAHGGALVAFSHPFESVADGAIGQSLQEGTAEGGGDKGGEGFQPSGGFGQSPKKKRGGGKAAEREKIVETKGGGGGQGDQAGAYFHNTKWDGGVFYFLGKNGFETRPTTEMEAKLGEVGKWDGEADGGGFLLAGEIGFGALFIQDRQGNT